MKRSRLAVVCIFVAVVGCTSSSERTGIERVSPFEHAALYGMVYDHDNSACAGAAILVDDDRQAVADHDGRFVVSSLAPGRHRIILTKPGYERLEIEIDFQDPSQVLYARMTSLGQLLTRAEAAIIGREWREARSAIERATRIDPVDMSVRFLHAVLAYRKGEYQKAVRGLRGLLDEASEDNPPVIYLFLADIYEHHLGSPQLAVDALEHFLGEVDDPVVRTRLERLKSVVTTSAVSPSNEGDGDTGGEDLSSGLR